MDLEIVGSGNECGALLVRSAALFTKVGRVVRKCLAIKGGSGGLINDPSAHKKNAGSNELSVDWAAFSVLGFDNRFFSCQQFIISGGHRPTKKNGIAQASSPKTQSSSERGRDVMLRKEFTPLPRPASRPPVTLLRMRCVRWLPESRERGLRCRASIETKSGIKSRLSHSPSSTLVGHPASRICHSLSPSITKLAEISTNIRELLRMQERAAAWEGWRCGPN